MISYEFLQIFFLSSFYDEFLFSQVFSLYHKFLNLLSLSAEFCTFQISSLLNVMKISTFISTKLANFPTIKEKIQIKSSNNGQNIHCKATRIIIIKFSQLSLILIGMEFRHYVSHSLKYF